MSVQSIEVHNNDIITIQRIFKIVSIIDVKLKEINRTQTSEKKILHVIFNKDIKFVNPLFFSLVLQIHEQCKDKNIVLVFDIFNFIEDKKYPAKDPRQHYILRILLAMMNTPHFLPYLYENEDRIDDFREKLNIFIKNKIQRNVYIDNRQNEVKKSIVLLHSRKHKDSIFMDPEEDRTYRLLPIIKLTNFPNYIYTNGLSDNESDARKHVYQSITISYDSNYDSKVLKGNFEKYFIDIVKPNKYQSSIAQPLKDIFFEMVDNIKRHAKYDDKYADSYFNFYYDVSHHTFKFHIIDNLDTGFINTYIKTIQNDKQRLIDEGLKVDDFYDEALSILRDVKNDKAFLKSLFSEYGWFRASKIPRIILHFGFPLLVEIIKSIGGSVYIRLHRVHDAGNRFYEITIDKTGTIVEEITDDNSQIKGTYIAIDIPNKNYESPSAINLSLGREDFKNFENEKEAILKTAKTFVNGAKQKKQYAVYNFKEYTEGSISDFIRTIYIEAYQKKLSDVLVIGIDLKENIEYIETLAYLLYQKDYKDNDEHLPINILFWNNTSFDIYFIGGKNKSEFCKSNELLYKHYAQKNIYEPKKICKDNNGDPAQSIFFIKGANGELSILPFDILIKDIANMNDDDIWKEISYQWITINYLEKNKLNIHFDTQRRYHIDGFYKFDTIFQDSSFFGRIADDFTKKILHNSQLKNHRLAFVGIGKYLNLFTAIVLDMLKDKGIKLFPRYYIVADTNMDNMGVKEFLEEAVKNTKSNEKLTFIIITSVSFEGVRVNELIKKYFGKNYIWYNLIKISLQDILKHNIPNANNLLEIEIPRTNYHDLSKDGECSICTNPDKEVPLLKVSDNDEFKIENTYFGRYKNKKFTKSFSMGEVKFYNALSVGHIERGVYNHYLYYTKTVDFFDKNEEKIKNNFLSEIKVNSADMAILLLPMHCTVNRFASQLYRLIFDAKAKIFQLDKSKGIKNFHELRALLGDDVSKYKFYFIDDEISSGYTMEYFYSLVKSLGGEGFEKAFILIDRLDSADEDLVLNFLKSKHKKDIHIFSKLEIKPIKTEIESCFLCEKRNQYKKMLNSTTMDMNRFAIAKRIVKLNIQDSKLFDFEANQEFAVDDFRTYLKVYAADYAYEKFDDIFIYNIQDKSRGEILDHYHKFESKFIEEIYQKINKLSFENGEDHDNLLRQIARYEGSIVLLKAISMPKLAYYYSIRYMLTVVLIYRINQYIDKDPVSSYFNQSDLSSFAHAQKKEQYKAFLLHFLPKINMNYLNFLYKTASYFNIHYLLHKDIVSAYCDAVSKIKERDKDEPTSNEPYVDQSLVEYYQLASKLVASYSYDKAEYFRKSISSIFRNKNSGYNNLLSALLIENHYDEKIVKFQTGCEKILNTDDKMEVVLPKIEEILQQAMEDDTLKLHAIYVNKNMDLLYRDYTSYLEAIELVDIFNNYSPPLQNKENIEIKLTKGFLSKKRDKEFDPRDEYFRKRINNTWSNLYVKNYAVNKNKEVQATLVKLVNINVEKLDTDPQKRTDLREMVKKNDILWYKPIGCIVITYDKASKERHLELSKLLLSIQSFLVKYIKNKFSTGVIQEAIQKKQIEKAYNDLEDIINGVSHSYGRYINIMKPSKKLKSLLCWNDEEVLEAVLSYTTGLKYIFSISTLNETIKESENYVTLNEDFKKTIENFLKYAPIFLRKFNETKDELNESVNFNWKLYEYNIHEKVVMRTTQEKLKLIVFEIIFNALHANRDKKDIKISIIMNKKFGLTIYNNGAPIPNINSVFDKYVKGETGGTGMGLNHIRNYLEKNEMEIHAENLENMNYTVKFTIRRSHDTK